MTDIRDSFRRSKVNEREKKIAALPYKASVKAVQADQDRMRCDGHFGPLDIPVGHPYVGLNSWIRAVPEAGCSVIVQRRESNLMSHIAYISEFAKTASEAYEGRTGLWRRMNPGEMDICSTGAAAIYFGRRGNLELRGGVTYGGLYQDKLEVSWFAPLHRRKLHESSSVLPPSLGADEERIGVVKRPHPLFPLSQELFIPTVNIEGPTYAKEWMVALSKLIYHREGDVTDDVGIPEVCEATGAILRAKHMWRTEQIVTSTDFEVDFLGNVVWNLAPEALIGYQINVPASDFSVLTGKLVSFVAGTNFQASATTTASLDAPEIKLGSAATDFILKGTSFNAALKTYLSAIATAANSAVDPSSTTAAVVAIGTASTALSSSLDSLLSAISKTV